MDGPQQETSPGLHSGNEALAIIVASPDLIRVSCRTPHQMSLVNALCRAWEMRG
jgi:hypothetical protein